MLKGSWPSRAARNSGKVHTGQQSSIAGPLHGALAARAEAYCRSDCSLTISVFLQFACGAAAELGTQQQTAPDEAICPAASRPPRGIALLLLSNKRKVCASFRLFEGARVKCSWLYGMAGSRLSGPVLMRDSHAMAEHTLRAYVLNNTLPVSLAAASGLLLTKVYLGWRSELVDDINSNFKHSAAGRACTCSARHPLRAAWRASRRWSDLAQAQLSAAVLLQ